MAVIVNSTAWPPGRISGQTWSASPAARFGRVTTVGSPPAALIRCRPVVTLVVAKMIVPSAPQLAPRVEPSGRPSVTTGPPVIATFFSAAPAPSKTPIHWPSGETNGPKRRDEPGERRGVELIERPHEECGAVGADVNQTRAIRREGQVAKDPLTVSAVALGGVIRKRDTRGANGRRAWRTRRRRRTSRRR